MPKPKLNCRDLSNRVWSVMKPRKENDMADCIGVVYVKTKTKLLRTIEPGVVYDENQTRQ